MNKTFLVFILILFANINLLLAQSVDLTSVDEFFKVTSILKNGGKISDDQWIAFENSTAYKHFAESKNKFLINTIEKSINIAFGNNTTTKKDSILSITKEQMDDDKKLFLKKYILVNYLDINENYKSIKSFRENYDFDALVDKSKQRLSSFLRAPIDSSIKLKPVYFFFIDADGADRDDAIYMDFNLVYKMTEDQRIDFLAHEYFHNYRRYFENHDFNYKCDLNFCIDMIQNEGIADQIDKSEGYEKYYTDVMNLPELSKTMVSLYNQAEDDLEKFQNIIIRYSKKEISEKEMIDEILKVYKFNGHPLGFFMSNHIVSAGYENEMIQTFYNPYEFYSLYNKAAKKQNLFQFSNEFMDYLKKITKEYYR